ncbi:MAG: hypothetical protein HXO24_04480 [Prevotella sp.]|nr:hypothetical protein [Prevotella sp.]
MRRSVTFFILLSAIALLAACAASRKAVATKPTHDSINKLIEKTDPTSHCTLIIFYDSTIGKQPLLNYVHIKQCTVIYNYANFNAIAIQLAPKLDKRKTINDLQSVKGVLQVMEDQLLHLDGHHPN